MKFKVGDKVLYRDVPSYRGRIKGVSPKLITVRWKGGNIGHFSKEDAKYDLKVIK